MAQWKCRFGLFCYLAIIVTVKHASSDCLDPGTPSNGIQLDEPSFPISDDSFLRFACNENFFLSGLATLICQGNNTYGGDLPVCLANCVHPETPDGVVQHGEEKNHYNGNGESITYECLEGDYSATLLGDETIFCLNGTWSANPPLCFADCADIGVLNHGSAVGNLSHGDTLAFACDQGFTLVGESVLNCTDGAWSYQPPYCVGSSIVSVEQTSLALIGRFNNNVITVSKELNGFHFNFTVKSHEFGANSSNSSDLWQVEVFASSSSDGAATRFGAVLVGELAGSDQQLIAGESIHLSSIDMVELNLFNQSCADINFVCVRLCTDNLSDEVVLEGVPDSGSLTACQPVYCGIHVSGIDVAATARVEDSSQLSADITVLLGQIVDFESLLVDWILMVSLFDNTGVSVNISKTESVVRPNAINGLESLTFESISLEVSEELPCENLTELCVTVDNLHNKVFGSEDSQSLHKCETITCLEKPIVSMQTVQIVIFVVCTGGIGLALLIPIVVIVVQKRIKAKKDKSSMKARGSLKINQTYTNPQTPSDVESPDTSNPDQAPSNQNGHVAGKTTRF